jgi:superfamily II DNA or RNA helicase
MAASVGIGRPVTSLDPLRFFSRAQVRRAWERQDRRCALCRRELPVDLMEGDHVLAHAHGGLTTMDNLQALCGSCNARKGAGNHDVVEQYFAADRMNAGTGELRAWQEAALPIVLDVIRREPVLVEACPGAGKTHFGLEVAYRLVQAGEISRVLIVAPTLGIVDGWQAAASASSPRSPTLPFRGARDWRPHNPIGEDFVGVVFTYQTLFQLSDMILAHATDPGHRTLVIFDEVHHVGAESAWGKAAQEAFAHDAAMVLSLSGTPFRTDRDAIAFVPSEGGYAKPHYRYSYDDAIADSACRPVQFIEARGTATFRSSDGNIETVSFDDENITEIGQRRRLIAALEAIGPGTIAAKMLHDANQYVLGLRRQGDRDAAGLVVCVDCDHAAQVASYMKESIGGEPRPVVVCSRTFDAGDPAPADAVRWFKESHDPWIVAVNMVSEGVDITRLRAVVYLTNKLTLLSFRQIVGRVVRADPTNVDDHGRVYIPADHRLIDMARKVTEHPELLPRPIRIEVDQDLLRSPVIRSDLSNIGSFETIDTVAEQGGAFDIRGRDASAGLIEMARRYIQNHGLTGTSPETLALAASENPGLRDALLGEAKEI